MVRNDNLPIPPLIFFFVRFFSFCKYKLIDLAIGIERYLTFPHKSFSSLGTVFHSSASLIL